MRLLHTSNKQLQTLRTRTSSYQPESMLSDMWIFIDATASLLSVPRIGFNLQQMHFLGFVAMPVLQEKT